MKSLNSARLNLKLTATAKTPHSNEQMDYKWTVAASLLALIDVRNAIITYVRAGRIATIPIIQTTDEDAKGPGTTSNGSPAVTLVVPARNEAANIVSCVESVMAQNGISWRAIVCDDASEDGTGDLALKTANGDPRISVLRLEGPPPGWAGKVHAITRGAELAELADKGSEWILFMDADCRLAAPSALSSVVSYAQDNQIDLVSLGSAQSAPSTAWPLITPIGLSLILDSAAPDGKGTRQALAVGHFILVRQSLYRKVGTYATLKSSRADDVDFATLIRDSGGGSTQFAWGTRLLSSRQHASWSELWQAWRKSFHAGTSGSIFAMLSGGLFFLAWGLAPLALIATRDRKLASLGAISWSAQLVSHRSCARGMGVSWIYSLAAPFAKTVLGGILIDAGLRASFTGGSEWKGRSVMDS